MDDIGSQFDDDYFEKPETKREDKPSTYNAKILTPHWFLTAKMSTEDESDALMQLKNQADFFYSSKDFEKAAEAYQKCVELVPSNNTTWRIEFMENVARSFIHIGDYEKALEWSLRLDAVCTSLNQKIESMNLVATVCHKLGKYNEELEALHFCMEVHKLNPEFWFRLGLCYASLFQVTLPGQTIVNPSHELIEKDCCPFRSRISRMSPSGTKIPSPSHFKPDCIVTSSTKSDDSDSLSASSKCEACVAVTNFVSSCFIHTKMLCDSSEKNLHSPEKEEEMKSVISKSLEFLETDPLFVEVASKMLGQNFLEQSIDCDDLDSDKNLTKQQSDPIDISAIRGHLS